MPVDVLWPLGEKILICLCRLGVGSVGEIQSMEKADLIGMFGQAGHAIYEYSLGMDRSSVLPLYPRKSAAFHKTFDCEVVEEAVLEQAVREGASFIEEELKAHSMAARSFGILLESVDDRSTELETRPIKPLSLYGGAHSIYRSLLGKALKGRMLRGPVWAMSLTANELVPLTVAFQADLFAPYEASDPERAADLALGRVREKFGAKAVFFANALHCSRRDKLKWHGLSAPYLAEQEAYSYEEGQKIASSCGSGRATPRKVLLGAKVASDSLHYG